MVKKRRNRTVAAKATNSDVSSSDELNDARVNFEGALQGLSRPPKDDSESSDEEREKKEVPRDSTKEKPARKHQPFVMKLFDRSVDLAQFSENSPLYPMCRAWMLNQPHLVYNLRRQSEENETTDTEAKDPENNDEELNAVDSSEEQIKDVYRLPPPEPHTDETLKAKVPEPVEHDTKDTLALNGSDPPSKDELLKDNLIRWNKVKRSWLKASAENEKRYEKSFKIFTTIYDKAIQTRQY